MRSTDGDIEKQTVVYKRNIAPSHSLRFEVNIHFSLCCLIWLSLLCLFGSLSGTVIYNVYTCVGLLEVAPNTYTHCFSNTPPESKQTSP